MRIPPNTKAGNVQLWWQPVERDALPVCDATDCKGSHPVQREMSHPERDSSRREVCQREVCERDAS